jgi:hypothetical protein
VGRSRRHRYLSLIFNAYRTTSCLGFVPISGGRWDSRIAKLTGNRIPQPVEIPNADIRLPGCNNDPRSIEGIKDGDA